MMGNRFFKKSKTKGGTSNKNSETSSNHYYKCKDTSKNPVETDEIYLNDISDYVAIFNYDAENNKEISLKKNDPIELIKDEDVYLVNYCPAQNLRTNETGLIPSACIALRNSLESQDWFFPNTTRREAERVLEYLDNEHGLFLIRESEHDRGNYALSILCIENNNERKTVHYKITKTQKNAYYLEKCKPFVSVQDLIYHYTKFGLQLGGYNFKLLRPHPKETNFSSVVDVWEESRENIQIMERIGFGNFGEVNRGIWRKKHVVAVKTIKLVNSNGRTADNSRFIEFKKELEILKTLRHDKIVKLWCVCTKDQPLLLVTEYMKNGSLLTYLREKDGRWIDFRQTIDMAAQIASGMWYLERSNCIHRDLAARNILVGTMNIVKIGDFGLAELIGNNRSENNKSEKNIDLPVKWCAVEVFNLNPITGKRPYSKKSDVWSFGIVLYELITKGDVPYSEMSNREVIDAVKRNYRMPRPHSCEKNYYNIMLKCWHENPNDRPTFEALFHTFDEYEGVTYQ